MTRTRRYIRASSPWLGCCHLYFMSLRNLYFRVRHPRNRETSEECSARWRGYWQAFLPGQTCFCHLKAVLSCSGPSLTRLPRSEKSSQQECNHLLPFRKNRKNVFVETHLYAPARTSRCANARQEKAIEQSMPERRN